MPPSGLFAKGPNGHASQCCTTQCSLMPPAFIAVRLNPKRSLTLILWKYLTMPYPQLSSSWNLQITKYREDHKNRTSSPFFFFLKKSFYKIVYWIVAFVVPCGFVPRPCYQRQTTFSINGRRIICVCPPLNLHLSGLFWMRWLSAHHCTTTSAHKANWGSGLIDLRRSSACCKLPKSPVLGGGQEMWVAAAKRAHSLSAEGKQNVWEDFWFVAAQAWQSKFWAKWNVRRKKKLKSERGYF